MSFFIRNKGKGGLQKGKLKRKNTSVAHPKDKGKKDKELALDSLYKDEVSSDEDEEFYADVTQHTFIDDDDELETAQEKKLKLAKKYLEEIEKEERERLETEDVDDSVILNRLKDDVLQEEGKLRKYMADKITEEIIPGDITILRCKEHNLSITCTVISSDSKYLYSGSKDASIVKWSLQDKKKIKSIPSKHKKKDDPNVHSSPILSLAISYDGRYLASSDDSKVIRLWNGDTLEFAYSFSGHRAAVTGLAFCRFTQNLYSSSHDRTVKVWSISDRAYIETLFGHQNPITGIDVLSKDRAISSGGTDNTVRVWKIQEESQLIFNGKLRNIDSVKRLSDKNFISCGEDGSISIWGIFKKKPLCTLSKAHGIDVASGDPYWISSIGTLSNTEVFASGSCDGKVRLWRCGQAYKSATTILEIPVTGFVNSIAFSSDEKHLIIGVGQEHRLGRWSRIKEAKNSILILNIEKKT